MDQRRLFCIVCRSDAVVLSAATQAGGAWPVDCRAICAGGACSHALRSLCASFILCSGGVVACWLRARGWLVPPTPSNVPHSSGCVVYWGLPGWLHTFDCMFIACAMPLSAMSHTALEAWCAVLIHTEAGRQESGSRDDTFWRCWANGGPLSHSVSFGTCCTGCRYTISGR